MATYEVFLGPVEARGVTKEKKTAASAALTAGCLAVIASDAWAKPSASAAAAGLFWIEAQQNPKQDFDTAIPDGETVQGTKAYNAYVNALLASGQNIAAEDTLAVDANGELVAAAANPVVAVADEAVNATGGRSRIRVRSLV